MKKIIIIFIICLFYQLTSFAITYDDISSLKEPAYRVGSSDDVENKIEITPKIQKAAVKIVQQDQYNELTYADLSIKKISLEVSQMLEIEYDTMLADLSTLWQGAATKSETIKFALYKLANPNEDKPSQHSVKKVLMNIANMSTLIGASTGNPIIACASLIGGNTLGIMSQDAKAMNYKYTKVADADMIILVRKVDELQQKVVENYFDYMTTKKVLDMTQLMAERRYDKYEAAQATSKEVILITDAYYREALNMLAKAKGDFSDARSRLEQLVGAEIMKQFENNLKSRNS